MRSSRKYSLQEFDSQSDTSQLSVNGESLPTRVDGKILEAQFELNDGETLLWLTDDSPYDEGLHVYLINRDDEAEDALEAGAVFAPGILQIISAKENAVIFKFFKNDVKYKLSVEKQPRIKFSLLEGWKYKSLLAKHRLTIKEEK